MNVMERFDSLMTWPASHGLFLPFPTQPVRLQGGGRQSAELVAPTEDQDTRPPVFPRTLYCRTRAPLPSSDKEGAIFIPMHNNGGREGREG